MAKKRIKRGARLRDVAAAAGVSRTTVSAVVNGKAERYGICPATRAKVEAAVRQLGYVPSLAALDLVSGRNSLVALAISAGQPGADRLIAAMEPALAQSDSRLIVVMLPDDQQGAAARIASLLQFGIAGLLVYPSAATGFLPKINCPAVMVVKTGAGLPAVYEDEVEGGRRLARRLLDKGHRAIAIVGGTTPHPPVVSGFLEACAQYGATARLFPTMPEFLAMPGATTALFCVTSAALLELYSRASAVGLRLDANLAVVAMDNLGVAANLIPMPTVYLPDMARLGKAAAQLLQQAIQGTVPGDVRLDPVITDGDNMPSIATKVPVVPVPPIQPAASPKSPAVVIPGHSVTPTVEPAKPVPAVVKVEAPLAGQPTVSPVETEPIPSTVPEIIVPAVEPELADSVEAEPVPPTGEQVPVVPVQQEPDIAEPVVVPPVSQPTDNASSSAEEAPVAVQDGTSATQEPASQPLENSPIESQPGSPISSSESIQMTENTPGAQVDVVDSGTTRGNISDIQEQSTAEASSSATQPLDVPQGEQTSNPRTNLPEPEAAPVPAVIAEPVVTAPAPEPVAPEPVIAAEPVPVATPAPASEPVKPPTVAPAVEPQSAVVIPPEPVEVVVAEPAAPLEVPVVFDSSVPVEAEVEDEQAATEEPAPATETRV